MSSDSPLLPRGRKQHAAKAAVTRLLEQLCKVVSHALAGERDAAHEIVQKYEDDETACWIHAVLHRIEGDAASARY